MSEHTRSRIGQRVGNYHLTHLLGEGGFADVYLGEHIFLKTQAAIKLIRLHLASDRMESFLNEAQTIAKLRHPHIVHVFECGIEDGTPFLVMDYIPNGSLRQRHLRGSRLLPGQIVPYVQQISSALYYAHQQKLIHRDIKPENMLLGQNGEVLLSDFGLVLVAQSSGSQTIKEMAGTVPYMAPEQLQGKPRIASDQYALGIVVYEWLCGERPFTGSFVEIAGQHMMAPPPPLCQKVPTLPPAIEQVVFKALAKDSIQRFESVQAFADAFTNAVQNDSVTFVSPLKRVQQPDTPLPSPTQISPGALKLPTPLEPGGQDAQFSSSGNFTARSASQPTSFSTQPASFHRTPSEIMAYDTVEHNSSPGGYPSQPSREVWKSSPAPQKRRGLSWAVLCLLVAFLLIAGSASFLLTHPGILPGRGQQEGSKLSQIGTTTATPRQTTLIVQPTLTVQPTTPAPTHTTPLPTQPTSTQPTPTPAQTTPTPTPTPVGFAPKYAVVDHVAQTVLPVQVSTILSAKCSSGEQMLSGGYYVSDRVNPVAESYPSASDTWTVAAVSGYANTTLYVYVTCLQANFSAHVQIFSFTSSVNNPNTFTCPSGSTLTGGGFRDYAALAEPNGNGWLGKPAFGGNVNYNFVLCATTNLLPATPQVIGFSVSPQSNSGLQTLSCPSGTQLTGGGFAYDYTAADVYVNVPRGDSPIVGWSVGVYNNNPSNTQTASAWAICVQIPATVY